MLSSFIALYKKAILERPIITLVMICALILLAGFYSTDFKLDASADSLVLEHDEDLRYYRSIRARYGSDDFLVITYTPENDLFSSETLKNLRMLRDDLLKIENVETVVSILDVPLINSPKISLTEIEDKVRTLEDPDTDIELARREFLESPLYQNLIISPDGKTTALQVILRWDETFYSLVKKRDILREKQLVTPLSPEEKKALRTVSKAFDEYLEVFMEQQSKDIASVRKIMDQYRHHATLYLGGVPMIASDMIDFIRHDLLVFGLGVLCFLIIMLTIFFRKPRWIVLPMFSCFSAVLIMFGFLGFMEWQVTVVSSNFTSLLLIITLSLTVHLIVRYHELQEQYPRADQINLVFNTVKTKALPSLYTALTTIVAFGSLLVSGIRPVIDFGWMMSIGIALAFLLSFMLFPAGLMLLTPLKIKRNQDFTGKMTRWFAVIIEHHGTSTLIVFLLIMIMSAIGISRLTVENRFIDHFKKSTEIYQGMEKIDRELGGTTPLDVVVDADAEFLELLASEKDEEFFEDEFDDEYEREAGLSGTSYWYNSYRLDTINAIHDYLNQLPETGKVLSLATVMEMMKQLNDDAAFDNVTLSVIYKKLPEEIKKTLFDPYMSEDGNQIRLAVRVFESDPSLKRKELLQTIHDHLIDHLGFTKDQFHLTGMLVLYNNMLQSLFRSQILTLGVVFLAIIFMFMILFKSINLAIIGIIPNLVSAGMVLGLMGWLNIPLDMMTITIAAITIGIAVDDTIHYIHRFQIEIQKDYDYTATVRRCHASVGRAMYYTSVTIIIGFSILALSSFIPTIYFGLLTGFAMLVALVANLTLLPLLLVLFKPAGKKITSVVLPQQL